MPCPSEFALWGVGSVYKHADAQTVDGGNLVERSEVETHIYPILPSLYHSPLSDPSFQKRGRIIIWI